MAVNSLKATIIMLHLSFARPQRSSGLLNPKAITIWTGQFFAGGGGCPVHFWMPSGIPDLYPRDASSTPAPIATIRNISRPCQMSPTPS